MSTLFSSLEHIWIFVKNIWNSVRNSKRNINNTTIGDINDSKVKAICDTNKNNQNKTIVVKQILPICTNFHIEYNTYYDNSNGSQNGGMRISKPNKQIVDDVDVTHLISKDEKSETQGKVLNESSKEYFAKEKTSEQLIIDEAKELLPKLSKENIAILTILTFIRLFLHGNRTMLNNWLKCFNPIIDILSNVNRIDMEYLVQTKCVSRLPNPCVVYDMIKISKNKYPYAFCHPISPQASKDFREKYGQLERKANGSFGDEQIKQSIMAIEIFDFNTDNTITPKLLSKDDHFVILQENGLQCMKNDIEVLLNCVEMMSDEEIISYYNNLNPNWGLTIKMLKDKPLSTLVINPVGIYIGGLQIKELTNCDVSLGFFYKKPN